MDGTWSLVRLLRAFIEGQSLNATMLYRQERIGEGKHESDNDYEVG